MTLSTPTDVRVEPVTVREQLDKYARELDETSRLLGAVERDLGGYQRLDGTEVEGVQAEYDRVMDHIEVGMWTAYEEGAKLPPADMRRRLARRRIEPELLGRYERLVAQRNEYTKRIREIKALVSAQQTLMAGLKAEMEASR